MTFEDTIKQILDYAGDNNIDNLYDLVNYCNDNNKKLWFNTIVSRRGFPIVLCYLDSMRNDIQNTDDYLTEYYQKY